MENNYIRQGWKTKKAVRRFIAIVKLIADRVVNEDGQRE